jgi:hypothetical protein
MLLKTVTHAVPTHTIACLPSYCADAPGMTDADIKVELHDNVLLITGEKSQQAEYTTPASPAGAAAAPAAPSAAAAGKEGEQQQQEAATETTAPSPAAGARVWRRERGWRRFQRSFQLPDDAQAEGIRARLERGVLTVQVRVR